VKHLNNPKSNSFPSLQIQRHFLESFVNKFNQTDCLAAKLVTDKSLVTLILSYNDQETIEIPYSASHFNDCIKNPQADWPPVAVQQELVAILDQLFSIPLNERI